MQEQVRQILYELLHYRRAADTSGFEDLRHNADLCPAVDNRFKDVLEVLSSFVRFSYDTQGFRDQGVDVAVAVENGERITIGSQVKADDEAEQKDVVTKLKAQLVDAQNHFGDELVDFYILPGWNRVTRLGRLRQVNADFVNVDNVHVIDPAYLWTFLYDLQPWEIEAIIRSVLSADDPLLERFYTELSGHTTSQVVLLMRLLDAQLESAGRQGMTLDDLMNDPFLVERLTHIVSTTYGENLRLPCRTSLPDPEPLPQAVDLITWLAEDLEALADLLVDDQEGRYLLDPTSAPAVFAVAMEARARFGRTGAGFCDQLTTLGTKPDRQLEGDWAWAEELATHVDQSTLAPGDQSELLARLLRLNCPLLCEDTETAPFELEPFDVDDLEAWEDLAVDILDELLGSEPGGWIEETRPD